MAPINWRHNPRRGTREVTVKTQRGRVMRRMGVGSVADLVRIAEGLERDP